MAQRGEAMAAFIGVPADRRLLGEDIGCLPDAEQHREPPTAARVHHRLVAVEHC